MKHASIDTFILKKVATLMVERRIKKTELGVLLGPGTSESSQQRFLRGQRFLNGKASLKVSKLVLIAEFFDKPLAYFFPSSGADISVLYTSESSQSTGTLPLRVIEKNLRRMGFDEDFIKNEIRQLRALKTYKEEHEDD